MFPDRLCPSCAQPRLALNQVLSLGGDTVVGRWACGACAHVATRYTPSAALLQEEREHILIPFQQRLAALRAGRGS